MTNKKANLRRQRSRVRIATGAPFFSIKTERYNGVGFSACSYMRLETGTEQEDAGISGTNRVQDFSWLPDLGLPPDKQKTAERADTLLDGQFEIVCVCPFYPMLESVASGVLV